MEFLTFNETDFQNVYTEAIKLQEGSDWKGQFAALAFSGYKAVSTYVIGEKDDPLK